MHISGPEAFVAAYRDATGFGELEVRHAERETIVRANWRLVGCGWFCGQESQNATLAAASAALSSMISRTTVRMVHSMARIHRFTAVTTSLS